MSNNKQQSAVEWFLDQLIEHRIIIVDKTTYQVKYKHEILLEQAKEMEKEQREMSYADGYAEGYNRAMELTQWAISNLVPSQNESK
jgi:predicted nucleic acid-binding protein